MNQTAAPLGEIGEILARAKQGAGRTIEVLAAAGILIDTGGNKRDRGFAYQDYIDRMQTGTELERKSEAAGFKEHT